MNKRLVKIIHKYGKRIKDGTWIDCYSGTINNNICGTILTGVDYRNLYFVAVEDRNEQKRT